MASSNYSITSEASSKYQLPTTKPSVMAESKISRSRQFFITDDASPSNFQKIVAELVGTYVFIFVGCGSALTSDIQKLTIVGIAIVWGVVLMALIYALGHISGAHFNPAVSIALATIRKFSWKHVPMFILAQILGATLASLTLKLLFNHQDITIEPITTQYSDPTTDLQALAWEFIITFILMFNICSVATDHRASKDFAGIAIGGTLLVNVMIAGPITGASMNPARSLGPAVATGIYDNIWVFVVAPIVGAQSAALVYSILRVPKPEKAEDSKSIFNHLYISSNP